jgi:hypothetical protein
MIRMTLVKIIKGKTKIAYKIPGILLLFVILFSCKLNQRTTPIAHTECDSLFFDLDTGMINSVSPMLPPIDIKEWFTCYTGSTPDGASTNCGGGVFYANHGFYYYTYFNFVEVHRNFKGKESNNLLSAERKDVIGVYGQPVITRFKEDYPDIDFFNTKYGCLQFRYDSSKVVKISAHHTLCENVEICN